MSVNSSPAVWRTLRLSKQALLTATAHKPVMLKAALRATFDPRPPQRLASRDSLLVVEGFGGSANTFITAVLQMNGVDHLSYAHHVHTPSQLSLGAELGIPTLVVVREPLEAITSLLRRGNIASVRLASKQYLDMYETALNLGSAVAIFRYEDITTRIDRCFEEFNSHFPAALPFLDGHPSETSTRPHRPGSNRKDPASFLTTEVAHAETVRRLGPKLVARLGEMHSRTVAVSLLTGPTRRLDETA